MSEVEWVRSGPSYSACMAIDWADKKHVWCLQVAGAEQRESRELEHSPEAVEAWVVQLCQRFCSVPIAVAVEQSRGALVFMLSKYEALHSISRGTDDGGRYARSAVPVWEQG